MLARSRRLRRKHIVRALKIGVTLAFCGVLLPVLVALGRVGVECRPWSSGPAATQTQAGADAPTAASRAAMTSKIPGYARSEDQTFLTLPEWYIVYSADEYAAFVADNPPSAFPYFGAIGQFWASYYNVCEETRAHYAFNGSYHLIMAVIGTSFTVENIVKGSYENTIGRITELISSSALTEEDAYAQAVAAEYGSFLHTIPWYEFPFSAKLKGLWSDTPLLGSNLIRKAERKGALSAEYSTKAAYAWLIKGGTKSVYEAADLEIYVWLEGLTQAQIAAQPAVRLIQAVDDQTAIVALPRYEAFTQLVPQLVNQGARFVEIAGNDQILITVIAPRDWQYNLEAGATLFAQPILTNQTAQRMAIKVPVAQLHQVLRDLESREIALEHIYDY